MSKKEKKLFISCCEKQGESSEAKEAIEKVARLIGDAVPDAEDVLSYIGYLYEKQGFQNGYRCAMEGRCLV